jgi:hypothetical protein
MATPFAMIVLPVTNTKATPADAIALERRFGDEGVVAADMHPSAVADPPGRLKTLIRSASTNRRKMTTHPDIVEGTTLPAARFCTTQTRS